jgi:hypothetical protein
MYLNEQWFLPRNVEFADGQSLGVRLGLPGICNHLRYNLT